MASPGNQGRFPASANQRRMFVLNRLSPDGTEYNVPVAVRLKGNIHVGGLRDALSALVVRHPSLRTSFSILDGEIVQKIHGPSRVPMRVRTASGAAGVEEIRKDFVRPFDLCRAPLLRACLIRLEERECVLLLDLHHIVCDGVSVDILVEDLGRLYDGQTLGALAADYKDFALWQAEFAGSGEAARQEEYWLRLLGNDRPVLTLPIDFPRRRVQSVRGARVFARPGRRLADGLRALAAKSRVSMYMLLLAAYYVLMSKYSGQEDITVGTLAAGRRNERFQGIVGLFVNTLVLRSQPDGSLEFIDYLKRVRDECLGAFENQDYQFEDLVERISPPRDLGRTPLFDTMFATLTMDEAAAIRGGVEFSRYELEYEISKFDLSLTAMEQPGGALVLEFEYCADLYRRDTVERLSAHYLNLLEDIVADPHIRLSEINVLSAAERRRAVIPPPLPASGMPSVVEMFRAQARANPDAPAVACGDRSLDYGTLDRRSSQLAARLRRMGVGRGGIVGLVGVPSIEAVVAIWGVLKLGAAYLPMEPAIPPDRFRAIVADSGLSVVLLQGTTRHFSSDCPAYLYLDDDLFSAEETPAEFDPVHGDDLAYVIYTSGSTGTPKGVMIPHRALANYITWAVGTYFDTGAVSFSLQSPLSVDLTVTSVFAPLVSGNRIVIYRNDDALGLIRDIIGDDQVEVLKVTPTHLALLAEIIQDIDVSGSRLRTLIVGGEDLKTGLAAKIHAGFGARVRIFNEYGPTEATVGCMIHRFDPAVDTALSVPIGRAIDNTSILILDRHGIPVPQGVTGELHIAGICLADGYLNNPAMTGERFVVKRIGPVELRVYRSGDLARMLPSGALDYLGRNDDQVKLRGFRIELGEIEATLLRFPGITEAVVTRRLDSAGDPYLCAYFVAEGEIALAELGDYLGQHLPVHMIPARFMALERLPIARGGKVDRATLPDPGEPVRGNRSHVAPDSGTERAIARIWEQVLGLQRVGIDDDFFDLGGQSLKATLMLARVNRDLRASISLRDVFAHPSIRALAALVEQTGEDRSAIVTPVGPQEHYPVSAAQKRLFIVHQLAPRDLQYNVPFAIAVSGRFDAGRWLQAFRALIARHESLRTSVVLADDGIVQIVHPHVDFAFEPHVPGVSGPLEREIERFVRPFDLGQAPLMRATSFEDGPSRHTILVDLHHIVADGLSIDIILDDLHALYEGRALDPMAIHYKDYAAWQHARAGSETVRAQGAYWTSLFAGEVPVLNLPTDFARGAVQSFEGGLVRFEAGPAIVERLRAIGHDTGATMNMTLLAAYTILLSKYSGQEDVVVGIPVAGRNLVPFHRVVGMFVNTLATRNRPRGELAFRDYLLAVKAQALDAYSNQDYQFEELVDALAIDRDLSRNPLFDTVFAFHNGGDKSRQIDGAAVEMLDFAWNLSKFDLTLLAEERGDGIVFELEYCTRLFRRDTVERLADQFHHLLMQIAGDPARKLDDLDLLTEESRRQILEEFNRTDRDYPADQTIHGIFEAQAEKTPDNPAVVCGADVLSYLELNRRANQAARVLAHEGIATGQVVGIIAGPSVEMVVGILAILKAGGAYLPIDPDCPDDRIHALLAGSGAKAVVLTGARDWCGDTLPVLDLRGPDLYRGDDGNPGNPVGSHDLAYVIYTSGTTGTPKGVMIEHRAVNNLCAWHIGEFGITEADRATKYARFSFDASVWEIFPYLQAGAALHMVPDRIRLDLPGLNRFFEDNGITVSFLPTQVCELFMDLDNSSLRILLTGGDRLRRAGRGGYQLVNNYGPTENTVVTTSCRVPTSGDKIAIGRSIFNTRVYLLDKADKLVPIGVPGELCITGAGLARGYLNDPVKTAEKFVANPFEPMSRLYRTGDLARWLPDGGIEYLGRIDNQVKIRGCRIEPGEIEAVILAHGAVKDAVVVAREDSLGNKFLCAYLVWHGAARPDELRSHLARHLPDYMVPASFAALERIPLNGRGKVDAAKLPSPAHGPADAASYVPPRTATERHLADIWCRVLDRERIGIHDRFFEIGGDSLRATIMIARANKEFDTAVSLGAVFDRSSIAALAECFETTARQPAPVLVPVENRLYYATTPIQALLYRVCAARNGVEYNLPMAFELRGDLNIARLEGVFQELIRRHETLRSSFHIVGERVMHSVLPAVEFPLEILPPCADDEIGEVARDFIRPFDLGRAPLIRAAIVPMAPDRHALLMDMHHLVSDGTSMGLLFQQIAALYGGVEPPRPAVTFKDFAEWLDTHLRTEQMRTHEAYWREILDAPPPVIKLDPDFPRTDRFAFAGNRISFEGGPGLRDSLKALCAREGVTLYVLLLAAYNVMLSKYSGQEDIIVGVPTVGRYLADVHDVIGMFVSTHVIRGRPKPGLRFVDFLQQVKIGVQGAVEHQGYQLWDMIVSRLMTTGKQLFSTVFIVQDQAFLTMDIEGLDIKEIDPHYNISKFDLTVGAVDYDGRLEFELEYNTDLFRRSTARRIAGHYLNLLEQIVADPGRMLRQFELVTPAEKEALLHDFVRRAPVVADMDGAATVGAMFERQARAAPGRVAVVCDGVGMSYGALERRASRLARRLMRDGVGAGSIVGIMARPPAGMICAVLAIWKAGAACLPIGRNFPPRRVAHLLADSKARLLLCDADFDQSGLAVPAIVLDEGAGIDGPDIEAPTESGALAWVSYAADHAGQLKGVMIEHGAVLDRCRWFAGHFAVTGDDRGMICGDFSGVSALFEVFSFLCAGASVTVLDDGVALAEGLREYGVTIAWLPAPQCETLASLADLPLRVLITSGEAVSAERRGTYELVKCFGFAETMEAVACSPVGGIRTIIGQPLGHCGAYILGHDDGLLPVGISGELCLDGPGLARGYLGDDVATSRRFTSNPHVPGGRIFRSGLRAKRLADGRLELTGRVPDVIIAGQRVSLAEIERHLRDHPGITDAAVLFDDADPLRQGLCAFIAVPDVLAALAPAYVPELKRHLGQWLPAAMIPDTYMRVDEIPRDEDGRLVIESLPLPQRPVERDPVDPARTVAAIVEEVLGVPDPKPEADLRDLGLTSLTAMALQARLTASFGVAPDPCRWLRTPSISGISSHLLETMRGTPRALALAGQDTGAL